MIPSLGELGLSLSVLAWQAMLLTVISFLVGVLGGFVGLALGTMRLPALLLLGVSPPAAAGTNIIVSALTAMTGAVGHLRGGRVDMRVALTMGVPSMVGAFAGGFYSHLAPESLLMLAVGLLVLWQGVGFLLRARGLWSVVASRDHPPAQPILAAPGALKGGQASLEAGIGFGVGVLGGAVGLILGTLRLPALVRILHMDPHTAVGTNLFIGFVMGSMGWLGHATRGQVDYPLVVLMGSAAMAGSYLGARLTSLVDATRLVAAMGLVMLVVGALLIGRAVA